MGDAAVNTHVLTSLATAQGLLASSPMADTWRLQAHVFRAHFDAYVRRDQPHG